MSGQYGPPPQKSSGPSTGIIIAIIVLVVAAIGGGAYLLTSGDDDDETGGSTTTTAEGGQVTTLPGNPGTTQPGNPGGTDDTVTLPTGGDDLLTTTAAWVYSNTPQGVDETESTCIASVVIGVVGEDPVAQADGNLLQVYGGTSTEQDAAILSGIEGCVDADSASALAADPNWPIGWSPT